MKENEYISISKNIQDYLSHRYLHNAMELLKKLSYEFSDPYISGKIKKVSETYEYLSHYFGEGVSDPGRDKIYYGILEETYSIADMLDFEYRKREEYSQYASTARSLQNSDRSISAIADELKNALSISENMEDTDAESINCTKKSESLAEELFIKIWSTPFFNSDDNDCVKEIFSGSGYSLDTRYHLISALLLSSLNYFDPKKLKILINLILNGYGSETERLIPVAIVSIILIISKHQERVKIFSLTNPELSLAMDISDIRIQLSDAMLNLIRARDTERVNDKVKREFIPDIRKFQSELKRRFDKMPDETDLLSLDTNPEWEDFLSKSGMMDKMMEMQELQSEGADVMMFAFSNLKSFPFFNSISNWFLPFNPGHSSIRHSSAINSKLLSNIPDEALICDSDKFSLALSLQSVPESNRNMMMMQLEGQIGEGLTNKNLTNSIDSPKNEQIRFIRNLYRFSKLYSRKKEFYDPFADIINFMSIPVIGEILNTDANIRMLAEFYFRNGYYAESIHYFNLLKSDDDADTAGLTLQKKGFALQSLGDISGALREYLLAELHTPENKWLLRKIAVCYRRTGNYDAAIKYYLKALELEPDSLSLTFGLANTYLDAGRIEDALNQFYKADLLDESSQKGWRGIAWCEFLLGHFEKSRNYYDKIIFTDPGYMDYTNLGHLCMAESKFKEAIYYYSESMKNRPSNAGSFFDDCRNDLNILRNLGVSELSMNLILDRLKSGMTDFRLNLD